MQSLAFLLRCKTLGEVGGERVLKLARTIEHQVVRLETLVESLLDVSRVHARKFALERHQNDLRAVTEVVLERFRLDLEAVGSSVSLEAPAPIFGICDLSRLDQIVTNLLGNAIRPAPGAPIRISISRDESNANFIMVDAWPGIREQLPRLLVDSAPSWGWDSAFFAVRQLVEAHSGTIDVDSVPRATRFAINLPLVATREREPS